MGKDKSLWSYIKNYKFHSILLKSFFMIFFAVFLPLAAIILGIYIYYERTFVQEIGATNLNSLSRIGEVIDMAKGEVDKVNSILAYSEVVKKFIDLPRWSLPDFETVNVLSSLGKTLGVSVGAYVSSIYIYSEKSDYILSSDSYNSSRISFMDNGWYEDYLSNKNNKEINIFVKSRLVKTNASDIKNYISELYFLKTQSKGNNGVIVINMDTDWIMKMIKSIEKDYDESIYIIDQERRILFNNNPKYVDHHISMSNIRELEKTIFNNDITNNEYMSNLSFNNVMQINGRKQMVTCVQSPNSKWTYLSVISFERYDYKIKILRKIIIIALALAIIIIAVVAFVVAVKIYHPIKDIMHIMENPKDYDVMSNRKKEKGFNEFRFIGMNLLRSFGENEQMKEEMENRLQKLKKAQTAALQAQITPHFLFNTLQTIQFLVITHGKSQAQASIAIDSLAQILRAVMGTEKNMVIIAEELEYAKAYVDIESIRFKNKFDVIWDINDDVREYMIGKLTLQPIIENAIYHGIKPKMGKGLIYIHGMIEEDKILVEVEDNGVGMDKEYMKRLNEELSNDYLSGDANIGIRNVNQRIKLIFGDDYGLYISSGKSEGIIVKIVIPKVK